MNRVLHILPHPGGGGERVVEMLQCVGGFEHRRVYVSPTRTPLAAVPAIVGGRRSLRADAGWADLVHVIGDSAALIALPLMRGRPSVFGTHGLHLLRRARGGAAMLARARMRRVLGAASVVACTSESERRELRALDGAAPLELVLNGIALPEPVERAERERVRSELGLPPGALAVLYLGELEPRKHPLIAARAVLELNRSGEEAVLLAAGDGPLRGELEALASPAVRVLGFRGDADRLLAGADVFVMPSEREGLPLAVLEAMGRGLPVVVSDGVGNPEAVGDDGIVFPLGDVGALVERLRWLAANPAERASLGERARERVASQFSLERWQGDMRRVFEAALKPGATAPARAAGAGHA